MNAVGEIVVLVGLPGSGKTTVGRTLHEQHGWSWVDVDAEVERATGRSITELIRVEGEQLFRAEESKTLLQALKSGVQVISVGGGALMREENREALSKRGLVVHLRVSDDVAAKRVLSEERKEHNKSDVKRPVLFSGGEISLESAISGIQKLSREREKNFDAAQLKLWTDFSSPEALAKIIVRENALATSRSAVIIADDSSGRLSEIVLAADITELPKRLQSIFQPPSPLGSVRAALIFDANVKSFTLRISEELRKVGFECLEVEVPSGEASKNIDILAKLIDRLIEAGMTRRDIVVGIGGGVVGDLSGLLAAVYMRGIAHVQIPTSIVAQVDSAIGGKNAVNTTQAKNVVGTFHLPRLVFSSPDSLTTLPEREYLSGMAEVIKYGAIFSKSFFEWLELNTELIKKRDPAVLSRIVEFSSVSKTGVVAKDLLDVSGLRALLNFGHTVGHAIEKLASYGTLLHGEAIAIGMIEAASVGEEIGITPKNTAKRVALLLRNLGLPTKMPSELLAEAQFEQRWLAALKADKKREGDLVNFILLEQIGSAKVTQVGLKDLLRCIAREKSF